MEYLHSMSGTNSIPWTSLGDHPQSLGRRRVLHPIRAATACAQAPLSRSYKKNPSKHRTLVDRQVTPLCSGLALLGTKALSPILEEAG